MNKASALIIFPPNFFAIPSVGSKGIFQENPTYPSNPMTVF